MSIAVTLVVAAVAASAWWAIAFRRRAAPPVPRASVATPLASTPAPAGRKIKAHLFYVSMDGTKLVGVDREVAYGDGPSAQAREIVLAQLAPVAPPDVSAIPPGTTLRAVYLNDKGDAFVDLSKDVSTAHTGGTTDELLTIYSIVDALTTNLPAISSVQILVDGKEVDTLAGHVDLRRPLGRNAEIVE